MQISIMRPSATRRICSAGARRVPLKPSDMLRCKRERCFSYDSEVMLDRVDMRAGGRAHLPGDQLGERAVATTARPRGPAAGCCGPSQSWSPARIAKLLVQRVLSLGVLRRHVRTIHDSVVTSVTIASTRWRTTVTSHPSGQAQLRHGFLAVCAGRAGVGAKCATVSPRNLASAWRVRCDQLTLSRQSRRGRWR